MNKQAKSRTTDKAPIRSTPSTRNDSEEVALQLKVGGWLRQAIMVVTAAVFILIVYKVVRIISHDESVSTDISGINQLLAIIIGAVIFTAIAGLGELLTNKPKDTKDVKDTVPVIASDVIASLDADISADLDTRSQVESYMATLENHIAKLRAGADQYELKLRRISSELESRALELAKLTSGDPKSWSDNPRHSTQHMSTAKHYWVASMCAVIVAIVFSVLFTYPILNIEFLPLITVTTFLAVSMTVLSYTSIYALIGGQVNNHTVIKKLRFIISCSSMTLLIGIVLFSFSRLMSNLDKNVYNGLIIGIETSSIILAGAFYCGYRIYNLIGNLEEHFTKLSNEKEDLHSQFSELRVALEMLEKRQQQQEQKLKSLETH